MPPVAAPRARSAATAATRAPPSARCARRWAAPAGAFTRSVPGGERSVSCAAPRMRT